MTAPPTKQEVSPEPSSLPSTQEHPVERPRRSIEREILDIRSHLAELEQRFNAQPAADTVNKTEHIIIDAEPTLDGVEVDVEMPDEVREPPTTFFDREDNVLRCLDCGWEIADECCVSLNDTYYLPQIASEDLLPKRFSPSGLSATNISERDDQLVSSLGYTEAMITAFDITFSAALKGIVLIVDLDMYVELAPDGWKIAERLPTAKSDFAYDAGPFQGDEPTPGQVDEPLRGEWRILVPVSWRIHLGPGDDDGHEFVSTLLDNELHLVEEGCFSSLQWVCLRDAEDNIITRPIYEGEYFVVPATNEEGIVELVSCDDDIEIRQPVFAPVYDLSAWESIYPEDSFDADYGERQRVREEHKLERMLDLVRKTRRMEKLIEWFEQDLSEAEWSSPSRGHSSTNSEGEDSNDELTEEDIERYATRLSEMHDW
ncbi:hypothetical protein Rhopal_000754-T1 [Rhodotorula paludigena]|uniref:Uncharacterized protein n=1 Tax=Rhodotorula paludigena TaxID=86838 RepID=A0AAV5GEM2_9BASI|nr:hypothetical protein Rhopal_000754-T1 [Rhodotorula paludigena]